MKKKQRRVQLSLLFIGLLLFAATYLFYPKTNKDEVLEDQSINFEGTINTDKMNTFDSLEYKNRLSKVKTIMNVILYLSDERIVNITSDQGRYNKVTYDCFFEKNVKATDESTIILADNLDLLANKNYIEVYNNVILDHTAGYVEADKINYDLETKHFKVSMFDEKSIRMKIVR